MKKIKLFFMTLLSLLLPSCSNQQPPSSESSTMQDEMERLSTRIPSESSQAGNLDSSKNPLTNQEIKLPVSSGNSSFDTSGEIYPNKTKKLENIAGTEEKAEVSTLSEQNTEEKNLLGSYSTKVYTKTADRQKNLRIVCEKLSGTILAPHEEFSYNHTCGPYNKENGFGKATIFVGNGIEKQDYGGGVCQLSSTLYNAVKNLNVEITERHQHSKKVYYVPEGQDATVSYGNLDFKFKNKNDYSLRFEASSNANSVNVKVYKV